MTTQPESCVHHWKIASPDGRRMLPATCLKCSATREFPASGDDPNMHSWQPHVPGMQRAPITYIYEV
jgi:hypothetical protein